jgi:N6-L-threonylcarbamoyladenine synthase
MRILAIETSCDETAVALLEGEAVEGGARFRILGNAVQSQIDLHKEYGGVFPTLAKREHARNLVPVLSEALHGIIVAKDMSPVAEGVSDELKSILEREPELFDALIPFLASHSRPEVNAIAVTHGPGLEPALWVGVNFAKALSRAWDIPLIPVNHMEGHILSALAEREVTAHGGQVTALNIQDPKLPILALLISGGHTELVLMKEWLLYELVGQTLDDAVGEAFDKVARMMHLSYPGGPEISKLAEESRGQGRTPTTSLPRPMLEKNTCDFSFAGLKTAVLYTLKDKELTDETKKDMAHEFENAVGDVLLKKTIRAVHMHGARTVVLGGGVSANTHIRRIFQDAFAAELPDVALKIPHASLTTDNAVMIGLSGYYRALRKEYASTLSANGNLALAGTRR